MSDPSKVLQYALTGTVPIANGGTNSTTALSGSSIMISNGSKIVQGAAGTSTTVLHGSSGGAPTYSAVSLINDVTGTLPTSRGGTGVTSFTVSGVLYGNGSAVGSLTPVNNAVVSYTGAGALQATTTLPAAVQSNITALGTIGTGTWNGTAISAGSGGTGQTTYAIGDILSANTTSTLSKIADVATGNALISGGVGVLPAWGKIGLTTHVSGTLPATNGGTGQSTYTAGDLLYASGTSALGKLAAVVSNNVLLSTGVGSAPIWGKVTPSHCLSMQGALGYWIFEDRKATSTSGGNSIVGSQTRLLNTTVYSAGGSVVVNTGTGVMLLVAGTYYIEASAPALGCAHQLQLYGVTAAGTYSFGTVEVSTAGNQSRSHVATYITLAGSESIRLDHNTSAIVTDGLGKAAGFSFEVYSRIVIVKVA